MRPASRRRSRAVHALRDERGAGSALGLGVVAVTVALLLLLLPLAVALQGRQLAANAADAAALAAADTAMGAVPGEPCGNAGRVAAAGGAELLDCRLEGAVATVLVARAVLGGAARAAATAGPEGAGRG
ncbi:Rv3654c family TadE-like protein [Arenivirga flava]|uniref:Rv3654c family TadE-like protein n=1 Tax=Arenivirga flava TaxID=1930060 RepID=UPI0024E094E7|nr:Rv3654c family TadE-like protein [Arenivirga flava]